MTQPKILVWDIETAHMVMSAFQLLNRHMIPYDNVQKESYLICAAWKWLGEKKINAVSVADDTQRFRKNPRDDTYVIKTLYNTICEADAIIHHYGDKFDYKELNTRLIKTGGKPLPEIIKVDTYKIAKNHFRFPSNRLDAIGKELKLGGKIKVDNQLWLDCASGKRQAVKEMVTYNKQDVALLEKVYYKFAPFTTAKINANLFGYTGCPVCGTENERVRGYRYTRVSKYARYQCKECGHWYQARTREEDTVDYK